VVLGNRHRPDTGPVMDAPREGADGMKSQGMPDIPLRDPGYLKTLAAEMPVVLGLLLVLAIQFRPAVLFAVLVMPPFALWSWSLSIWASRQRFTGVAQGDRRTFLDTTIRCFALIQVVSVVGSVVFLLIGLALLTASLQLDPVSYGLVLVLYGLAFVTSFALPAWFIRLELDWEKERPRTRLGRVLKRASTFPTNPGPLAGLGLALAVVAREILPDPSLGALAGVLGLAMAFGPILLTMTGFRKWQYLRRLREAEFGGSD
jgi:hypothetical protein